MLIEAPDEVAARLQEMAEARHITVGQMVDFLLIRDYIAAASGGVCQCQH